MGSFRKHFGYFLFQHLVTLISRLSNGFTALVPHFSRRNKTPTRRDKVVAIKLERKEKENSFSFRTIETRSQFKNILKPRLKMGLRNNFPD